ncbi:MAG: UspA domain protein [Actinoallomurus sp.]|nr:UspA domain protein [Actinoallomurus sp.]
MDTLVIAGVDGSADSLEALEVAVDEAVMRGCPLRIAHARHFRAPTPKEPEAVLEEAAAYARERSGALRIDTWYGHGWPGPYLTGMSPEATVLVVGSRGFAGFTGLLAGAVSLYVAGHAACPVLVVRPGSALRRAPESPGTVVVGLDPGQPVAAAMGFAFEEAVLRDVGVRVVVATLHPAGGERGMAEHASRTWRSSHPEIPVRADVVGLRPAEALIAASQEAGLLVLGTQARHDRLTRVGHAALQHAFCPVAVVPATDG